MSQHGTLRVPEVPEVGYRELSTMDPYRYGASLVFGVEPRDVTLEMRHRFKLAFSETMWVRLFGENRREFIEDLRAAAETIEDGINHGEDEDVICERVANGVDMRAHLDEIIARDKRKERESEQVAYDQYTNARAIGTILLIVVLCFIGFYLLGAFDAYR